MENRKNKLKILSYALALSLSTTSLTSCGNTTPAEFTYETNTEGEIEINGIINYERLKECKLIELELLNDENKLFIVYEKKYIGGIYSSYYRTSYVNVLTNKVIYADNDTIENLSLVNEYELESYLITYDEVKENYSIEDIERIIEKISENYEFGKEKTLEK